TDRWNVLVALTDSWSLPPCLVLWGADGYEVRSVDTAGTDWASADTLPAGEIRGDIDTPFDLGSAWPRAVAWTPNSGWRPDLGVSVDPGLWLLATEPVELVGWRLIAHHFQWVTPAQRSPSDAGGGPATAQWWEHESATPLDPLTTWLGARFFPAARRLVAFHALGAPVSATAIDVSSQHAPHAPGSRLTALDGTTAWAFDAPTFGNQPNHVAYERGQPGASAPGANVPRAERRLAALRLPSSGNVSVVTVPVDERPYDRLAPMTTQSCPVTT